MNNVNFFISMLWLVVSVWVLIYNFWRIKGSPVLKNWSPKRWYTTITIFVVSAGFLLLGLAYFYNQLRFTAHLVAASSWILMINVPCSIQVFNTDKTLKILRGVGFVLIAANIFLLAVS